ncbi:MAG: alpha-hydroxy acid oxidase [Acidimicrobiia bacterium]
MKLFGKLPVTLDRRPALERAFSIDALRDLARKKLPAMVFDFIDGGAEDEVTLRSNRNAFAQYSLEPRALVDVSARDTSVEVLGARLPTPLVLGPAGLAGVAWPGGERLVAQAANARGLPFVLSTAGSASIEEVAEAAPGPRWFQLYLWRDRDVTKSLVARAINAGYDVLCLTVDVPMSGQRERDLRHGWTIPPNVTVRNAFEVATHPGWTRRVMLGPEVTFRNFLDMDLKKDYVSLGQIVNAQLNPSGTWDDMAWLRDMWPGKFILKGVLTGADAQRAADRGADGIVVSNHGGRQLDGVRSALDALPEVVAAVGTQVDVLLDGGIRRGTDVIKALSLGAKACMFARPYMYGLGAGGEAGVLRAIDILTAELHRTMTLVGCAELGTVGPQNSFVCGPKPA